MPPGYPSICHRMGPYRSQRYIESLDLKRRYYSEVRQTIVVKGMFVRHEPCNIGYLNFVYAINAVVETAYLPPAAARGRWDKWRTP